MAWIGQKIRATKNTYDVAQGKWHKEPVRVTFSRQPFQEGGMRHCYRATEYDKNNDVYECVAKVFKKECEADDHEYWDEAKTQMIADSHAQEFNRKSPADCKIAFLPVSVLELIDGTLGGSKLCALEPFMRGEYVKHNDNHGAVETNEALPQAFSHYTYQASSKLLVCCDIQGVGDFYTDPQIHSHDGEGFGSGNMGEEGIERFVRSHACTTVCAALKLRPLVANETDAQMARRLQKEEDLREREAAKMRAAQGGKENKPAKSGYEENVIHTPKGKEATKPLNDADSSSSDESSWERYFARRPHKNEKEKHLAEAMRRLKFW